MGAWADRHPVKVQAVSAPNSPEWLAVAVVQHKVGIIIQADPVPLGRSNQAAGPAQHSTAQQMCQT